MNKVGSTKSTTKSVTDQGINPSIEIRDLTVSYAQQIVLWEMSCALPCGQLIGVIGPNGAGKSTLLKAIMGLIPIRMGSIRVYGHPLGAVRKRVGYVPQRESLDWDFPISVRQVVMMGRYGHMGLFKRATSYDKTLVNEALEATGMGAHSDKQIGRLSGGQQQRVLLARCLAQQPDLYLMDEPFAGVDAHTEQLLFSLLNGMCHAGKTIVIVFHNLQTVAQHFDWLVMLNRRLVVAGPTQKVFTEDYLQKTYSAEQPMLTEVRQRLEQQGVLRHS